MQRGIFLDRDGTINEEVDYLTSPDEVVLIPGAATAIRSARAAGFKVIIVTNQSAVARGLLTEPELHIIHQRLIDLLGQEEAFIDGIYYCPHHPDFGAPPYRTECDCRKPLPGLLLRAASDHGIDLSQSFVVGDRVLDVQTGASVGAYTILVRTGYGDHETSENGSGALSADYIANDLPDAVSHILKVVQTPTS